MRPLSELIDENDSAWPLVEAWIAGAKPDVRVLEVDRAVREIALHETQVTTRSPMGAIVYHSAGLLIDHGWLRILGAGGHKLLQRSLPSWNRDRSEGFYLIADDAVGGFFAINAGALGDDLRMIYYFSPDTLQWEACGMGYSDFLCWSMTDQLADFYATLRWPHWEEEVTKITADQVIGVYPFLFTSGAPIVDRHRASIPVTEHYSLSFELQKQLDGSSPRDQP
jgi:hypothetical protein